MNTQVRLEIDGREPFAGGMKFGDVGEYETLSGRIHFSTDPDDSGNSGVVDLPRASRDPQGLVEYATDFCILKPLDLSRGNGRLVYDVINRGAKRVLQFFNDASPSNQPSSVAHAGNGFLMRRGYSIVWSAWQGDVLPGQGRMTMTVPLAREDNKEITGLVRAEFIADESGVVVFPLSGNDVTASYDTASPDTSQATLSCREYEGDLRQSVSPNDWQFANVEGSGNPVPSSTHCYLPGGFRPGWIYELVYEARNPLVLSLGFTGLRDLVSFLLHAKADDVGTPNPLKHANASIQKAYAWGRSQSGRFIRDFVYQGFNRDLQGRRVFDAVAPHVAGAGRVYLNYRFAQPGRFSRQHADHQYPSDLFPFAYKVIKDPLTGKEDGILKRPDTDPLVMHTQTSSEYWERRGSLVHTDPLGNDLGQNDQTRFYLFASAQHLAIPNGTPQYGAQRHPTNPLDTSPLFRALLDALDTWATDGTPPPDSRIPSTSDGTAVSAEVVKGRFPEIPDVQCPGEPSRFYLQDYGPEIDKGIISIEPPRENKSSEYTVLVPQVDADGNDLPGIRTPHLAVPLATFTGWNFRRQGAAEKALAGVVGSYLPFAPTAQERQALNDPRPSLEERYPSRSHYVEAIARAAQLLVDQRFLLAEDAKRYVEQAGKEEALG